MMGLKQKAHENESLEDFYDRVQATLYSLEQPILAVTTIALYTYFLQGKDILGFYFRSASLRKRPVF